MIKPGLNEACEPGAVSQGLTGNFGCTSGGGCESSWLEGDESGERRFALRGVGGRPLRVLHIGNIANNAYKNVKLLNEAGLDCDVICYDYYHLMGAPEWEDAEIDGVIKDQFYPNWAAVNLHGFSRPRWFAQGPVEVCIQYLLARRRGQRVRAAVWWQVLSLRRWWLCGIRKPARRVELILRSVYAVRRACESILSALRRAAKRSALLVRVVKSGKAYLRMGVPMHAAVPMQSVTPSEPSMWAVPSSEGPGFDGRVQALVHSFAQLFPNRSDRLTAEELEAWRPLFQLWKALFDEYDIVQGYATDPFLPLLCGKRPYVAFEHGTIRDIPFETTLQGRVTAIGYALADGVFITNGDCLASVPKLHIRYAAPMLHPVDEREYDALARDEIDWHGRFGAQYLFLCTLRHDWKIKGTDVYLRALPGLAEALGRRFKLLLTKWGAELAESEALIKDLGVSDLVVWLEPIPRRRLIRMQKAIDVVFDQVALPHFGATAPEAIAAGVPVLMSYDSRSTEWIVSEPAPILAVRTPDDVVKQTLLALEPVWRQNYARRAREWTRAWHSYRRVVDGHCDMYRRCLHKAHLNS